MEGFDSRTSLSQPRENDANTGGQAQARLLRKQARLESMKMTCDLTQNKGIGRVYFSFMDGVTVAS